MSIEENKKIASEFAARFSANDMAGALDMIADDVTWWIPGKPGHVPGAGVFTKEQVAELFRRMAEQFPSGLQMTIKIRWRHFSAPEDARLRTETRAYILEEGGRKMKYMQFPGSLLEPVEADSRRLHLLSEVTV
jgi:ketosteroid isomerase-like protein